MIAACIVHTAIRSAHLFKTGALAALSHFEYVLTGSSFLIAIMISRVIATLSEVKYRKADFRHVSWLLVLTFHLMLYWWFGWRYREIEFTVQMYIVQILPTLVLLFTAAVLTPREIPESWSDYFDVRRKRFFAWYSAFWVLLSISQYFILGEIRPSVVPFALCLIGLFSKSDIAQRSVPVLMGIAFLLVGLVFPENL